MHLALPNLIGFTCAHFFSLTRFFCMATCPSGVSAAPLVLVLPAYINPYKLFVFYRFITFSRSVQYSAVIVNGICRVLSITQNQGSVLRTNKAHRGMHLLLLRIAAFTGRCFSPKGFLPDAVPSK